LSIWYTVSDIALWIVVILQTILIFFLTKLVVQFLNRFRVSNHGLESNELVIGMDAPLFRVKNHKDKTVTLEDPRNDYNVLVFVKEGCSTCSNFLEKLTPYLKNYNVFIISSEVYTNKQYAHYQNVHYIEDNNLLESYFVNRVPFGVLVDQQLKINSTYFHNEVDKMVERLNLSVKIAN
jgi:AhpC/TSA family